ncbi:tRNA (N(6)-L-threonylcarbamoyladenosine(37)-C(2))-methylthiotransferase MtaB [Patescibacteria group bacterium]|nr:tRNA (N(6)-L-threonylcarbamoyladenosine(37)-C(2))-methylthiotransferase MtaB [Patescibacteria group bacterium]MBU1938987.1 tRNA (N(6)-L-threonylcarbamoyladenosine(37)-C(2))-methylthiotransferase MtaB [Patescibacteria group bacterium]
MKIALSMTGCKNNRYELDQILRWAIKNKVPVVEESEADFAIINTCTVTSIADRKSRQLVRRTRNNNSGLKTIVFGCAARAQKKVFEEITEVDVLLGSMQEVITYLESNISDMKKCDDASLITSGEAFTRSRALVQIQDGCDNYCSYCIIASARGKSKNRPQKEIINEINKHVANGFNEVVLTGINIGAYGASLTTRPDENKFAELLEAIFEQTGIKKVRAGSLGPEFFNEKWYKVMQNPRFSRHLHLSIQSGSDSVLKRMRRNYTAGQVTDVIKKLRGISPDIAITADIIVGFPGETEAEFKETVQFVKKNRLAKTHIFPYSERQNTLAAKMEQVPVKLRRERVKKLQEVADICRSEFIKSQLGKKAEVLWEHSRLSGRAEGVTENYIRVRVMGARTAGSITSEVLTTENIDTLL